MPKQKPASKTAFVLSFPASTPAKEIVAKGKAANVKLSLAYVHTIRSIARRKKGGGSARGHRVVSAHAGHRVGSSDAETLLKAVAAELGLANAMTILQREHDRVHRLIGG